MKLRLHDCNIDLPNELDINERKDFVNVVLKDHLEDFVVTGDFNIDKVVTVKLDILATYILQGIKDIRKDKMIMSRYKEKRRPHQEIVVSNLPYGYDSCFKNVYYSINDENFNYFKKK